MRRRLLTSLAFLSEMLLAGPLAATSPPEPSSDLDTFMERVLARRDENWKKLQQYVLDERESVDVLGPGEARMFGLRREYTWFVKDGYFVRSPIRLDGVTLDDAERREYERKWIERQRRRDAEKGGATPEPSTGESAAGVGDVLRQTTEPAFVSAAYFLRFKFEAGRYAFVGRERLGDRDVLRIEYYPTRLFADEPGDEPGEQRAQGEHRRGRDRSDDDREQRFERQMNKVALVTLWVEPAAHQIVQYTFDNVGFDFLPGRALVRVEDVHAMMQMGEVFPGVWLPRRIDGRLAMALANGTYEARFDVDYSNYRQADVKVQVR